MKDMKTVKHEWEKFHDACYPEGCSGPNMHYQLERAFYSGCLSTLTNIIELAKEQSTETVGEEVMKMLKECHNQALTGMVVGSLQKVLNEIFSKFAEGPPEKPTDSHRRN